MSEQPDPRLQIGDFKPTAAKVARDMQPGEQARIYFEAVNWNERTVNLSGPVWGLPPRAKIRMPTYDIKRIDARTWLITRPDLEQMVYVEDPEPVQPDGETVRLWHNAPPPGSEARTALETVLEHILKPGYQHNLRQPSHILAALRLRAWLDGA